MNYAEDEILALRKLYYCDQISLVPDHVYDQMETEFLATAAADSPARRPGSDRDEDYAPHIRALALYLALRCRVAPGAATQQAELPSRQVRAKTIIEAEQFSLF